MTALGLLSVITARLRILLVVHPSSCRGDFNLHLQSRLWKARNRFPRGSKSRDRCEAQFSLTTEDDPASSVLPAVITIRIR